MSAKECLQHPWMQADKKMSKMSSQTLYLNSLNSNNSHHSSIESHLNGLNGNQQNSLYRQQTSTVNSNLNSPSLLHSNNNYSSSNLNELELGYSLQRALDILEKGTNNESPLSNGSKTPTILTPVPSSPRDTGLPPLHPYMSSRFCPSIHSSSSSLNRGASRQSLERLRSMSKSREVLVERLQNSSQRKVLSRSRERLVDGRFGLAKSDNGLFEQRSLFHSVELLPPFDWYPYDESIYSSFNSTNMLPIFSMLPMLDENNINNRQYKSLASMEKLSEEINDNRYSPYNSSYFTSRSSNYKYDYDGIMSGYRTDNVEDFQRRTNGKKCGIGKRAKSEENENERLGKSFKVAMTESRYDKATATKSSSPTKENKPEKSSKKEPQKLKNEKERSSKNLVKPTTGTSKNKNQKEKREVSPSKSTDRKRGSVSHIEQRIQERQERLQEKEEIAKRDKQNKTNKNNNKLSSPRVRSKETPTNQQRHRTHKSERHKNNADIKAKGKSKDGHSSMEESPCSSLESVTEFNNNNSITTNNNTSKLNSFSSNLSNESKFISSSKNKKSLEGEKETRRPFRKSYSPPSRSSLKQTSKRDSSENTNGKAKNTTEEDSPNAIYGRSNSLDSTATLTGSESTLGAEETEKLESSLKSLSVSDPKITEQDNTVCETDKVSKETLTKKSDKESKELNERHFSNKETKASNDTESRNKDSLTIISEEEENSSQAIKTSFTRSKSSMSSKKIITQRSVNATKLQPKTNVEEGSNRGRSLSMQNRSSFYPFKLSRSNSIHLDTPLTGKARPWGEVCDGAVNRACKMFSEKSVDIALVIRKSSDPTSDRL